MIKSIKLSGTAEEIQRKLRRFAGLTVLQAFRKLEVEWIYRNTIG